MKKPLALLLSLSLLLGVLPPAGALTSPIQQDIYIDGEQFSYETETFGAAFLQDSRIYVPVRVLGEELGYDVSWDNETWTASVEGPLGTVTMHEGDYFILVGDETIYTDTPAVLIQAGRNFVALRAYLEKGLGLTVNWVPGRVDITTAP